MTTRDRASLGTITRFVIVALIGLALLAMWLRPAPEVVQRISLVPGGLTISTVASASVGENITVSVVGAPNGEIVDLSIDAGYGPRHFSLASTDGTANFDVPASTGPGSGIAFLSAKSGDLVSTATVELLPGDAVSPLDLYLGPRTVVADADHFSMIVAVPKDRLGNPVADGTTVDYLVTRPNLVTESLAHDTDGLLSYIRVFSRTVTGRTRLSVEVQGSRLSGGEAATGPERSFLEVAGIPEPFSLVPIDPIVPADGHALVRIATELLRDEFGNELPDGTVVFLDASGATGLRRLRSVSIDGVAEFVLEAPPIAGDVELIASASGTRSDPLTLTFESAVDELPVLAEKHPDGILVTVGRVLSTRQSYVPDGTIVVVSADGEVAEAPLELGMAEIVLPAKGSPDRVEVTVLGTTVSATIGPSR